MKSTIKPIEYFVKSNNSMIVVPNTIRDRQIRGPASMYESKYMQITDQIQFFQKLGDVDFPGISATHYRIWLMNCNGTFPSLDLYITLGQQFVPEKHVWYDITVNVLGGYILEMEESVVPSCSCTLL